MRRADRWTACACALLLAGCAAPGGWLGGGAGAPVFREPGLAAPAAAQRVEPGRSTRAEVAAALGTAETIRFDSGYEIWVYRAAGARVPAEAPELVILFGPDGLVKKVRARPAYPAAR